MPRRSGLGRGLDALLPSEAAGPEPRTGMLQLPVDSIRPNPRQPRRGFDNESLDELADSIEQLGVLQPLLVRRTADGYELVAGERRLRAASKAGLDEVPVVEVDTDERGSLERALVENLHREDLNPIEEASAYRQLLDEGGLTQEALGDRLGRNRVTIANALRLLDLPMPIQRLLVDGRLTAGHGRALLGLDGNPFQERLAVRVAQEGFSVRETEDLVRRYQDMSEPGARGTGRVHRPPLVSEAQRMLSHHLQTRVRVEMGKRKGKIVLDFVSLEELERLLKEIVGDEPSVPTTASPG
jgi:ParB family transcriptional regulator, chromosome partitioning protein